MTALIDQLERIADELHVANQMSFIALANSNDLPDDNMEEIRHHLWPETIEDLPAADQETIIRATDGTVLPTGPTAPSPVSNPAAEKLLEKMKNLASLTGARTPAELEDHLVARGIEKAAEYLESLYAVNTADLIRKHFDL